MGYTCRMNWLDWLLLAVLAFAAVRGFLRGFVVEIASLVALVLGIWVASRYNSAVARWIGMDTAHEVVSFLVTFVGVLVVVHLLAKVITKAMDMAQLGLPNKVAGLFFGMVRSAFVLSVALNILTARTELLGLSPDTLQRSRLYAPLRAFAPLLVPALGNSDWLAKAVGALKDHTPGN